MSDELFPSFDSKEEKPSQNYEHLLRLGVSMDVSSKVYPDLRDADAVLTVERPKEDGVVIMSSGLEEDCNGIASLLHAKLVSFDFEFSHNPQNLTLENAKNALESAISSTYAEETNARNLLHPERSGAPLDASVVLVYVFTDNEGKNWMMVASVGSKNGGVMRERPGFGQTECLFEPDYSKTIGGNGEVHASISAVDIQPGDRFFIYNKPISEIVNPEEMGGIAQRTQSSDDTSKAIVQYADRVYENDPSKSRKGHLVAQVIQIGQGIERKETVTTIGPDKDESTLSPSTEITKRFGKGHKVNVVIVNSTNGGSPGIEYVPSDVNASWKISGRNPDGSFLLERDIGGEVIKITVTERDLELANPLSPYPIDYLYSEEIKNIRDLVAVLFNLEGKKKVDVNGREAEGFEVDGKGYPLSLLLKGLSICSTRGNLEYAQRILPPKLFERAKNLLGIR